MTRIQFIALLSVAALLACGGVVSSDNRLRYGRGALYGEGLVFGE